MIAQHDTVLAVAQVHEASHVFRVLLQLEILWITPLQVAQRLEARRDACNRHNKPCVQRPIAVR